MLIYIGRRVLAVVPVLFGVTLAVFSMLFLVPGDPVKMMLAEFVTNPDQVAQMRAQLHLDEPILQQYGRFVTGALRGDLGMSIRSRRPVATEIAENLASTTQLALEEALTVPLVDELSVWAFRAGVQGVKYNFNAYPVLGDATLRK